MSQETLSDEEKRDDELVKPTEKTPKDKVVDFFKTLGEWRDRILVVASALYLVGYIFWSVNAYANNLGLLPALQFQYIVAGFAPVSIVVGAVAFWRLFRFLTNLWLSNLSKNQSKPWVIIRKVIGVFVFIVLGGFIYSLSPSWALLYILVVGGYILSNNKENSTIIGTVIRRFTIVPYAELSPRKQRSRTFLGIIFFTSFVLFFLNYKSIDRMLFSGLMRIIPQDSLTTWINYSLVFLAVFGGTTIFPEFLSSFYRGFFTTMVILIIALISLLVYYERGYTQLPQEFGGVKPRCAYLDVKTENLSIETQESILVLTSADPRPVLRSIELEVLFTGSNIVMARAKQPTDKADDIVYEIPRSNIQTITWCK